MTHDSQCLCLGSHRCAVIKVYLFVFISLRCLCVFIQIFDFNLSDDDMNEILTKCDCNLRVLTMREYVYYNWSSNNTMCLCLCIGVCVCVCVRVCVLVICDCLVRSAIAAVVSSVDQHVRVTYDLWTWLEFWFLKLPQIFAAVPTWQSWIADFVPVCNARWVLRLHRWAKVWLDVDVVLPGMRRR